MAKGLETFLKRIKQDPSNETYLDRFLNLLEDETPEDRISYYQRLFDFLINFKPLLALSVCYLELRLARNIPSLEKELSALERVERAFKALKRTGKAEVVRNEMEQIRGLIKTRVGPPEPREKQITQTKPRIHSSKLSVKDKVIASTKESISPSSTIKPSFIPVLPPIASSLKQLKQDMPSKVIIAKSSDLVPPPKKPPAKPLLKDIQGARAQQKIEFDGDFTEMLTSAPGKQPIIDWAMVSQKLRQEFKSFDGTHGSRLEQWCDIRGFVGWTKDDYKWGANLVQRLEDDPQQSAEPILNFFSFLLRRIPLAKASEMMMDLALPYSAVHIWLGLIDGLLNRHKPRMAHSLLQRFCELTLKAEFSMDVSRLAGRARSELAWAPLNWDPIDGVQSLRSEIKRRPLPLMRYFHVRS